MGRRKCQTACSTPQQRNLRGIDRRQRLLQGDCWCTSEKLEKDTALAKPCATSTNVQCPQGTIRFRKCWSMRKSEENTYGLIAETGYVGSFHCVLVQKPVSFQEALKIPEAKAAEDKDWENEGTFQHGRQRRRDESLKSSVKRMERQCTSPTMSVPVT